jgi:hypothetical protein
MAAAAPPSPTAGGTRHPIPIPPELVAQLPTDSVLYSDGTVLSSSTGAFLGHVQLEHVPLATPITPTRSLGDSPSSPRLPAGVTGIPIPIELAGTLPPGSILGSDYNVCVRFCAVPGGSEA